MNWKIMRHQLSEQEYYGDVPIYLAEDEIPLQIKEEDTIINGYVVKKLVLIKLQKEGGV